MAQIHRFEDLFAWRKARAQAASIYGATRTGDFARDFGLSSQIQRASVSVMASIAEGFERRSPAEFARFLAFAGGSNAEVLSHLYVALDIGYLSPPAHGELAGKCREVGRLVAGLRQSLVRTGAPNPAFSEEAAMYDNSPPASELNWELGTGNWELATGVAP